MARKPGALQYIKFSLGHAVGRLSLIQFINALKSTKQLKQRGGEERIYYAIKVIMRRGLGY
jgi:hypothetical protein